MKFGVIVQNDDLHKMLDYFLSAVIPFNIKKCARCSESVRPGVGVKSSEGSRDNEGNRRRLIDLARMFRQRTSAPFPFVLHAKVIKLLEHDVEQWACGRGVFLCVGLQRELC